MELKQKFTKRGGGHGLWKSCFCPMKSQGRVTAKEELHQGRVISTGEDDGVVRVRIVVSKHELEQIVASMRVHKRRNDIDGDGHRHRRMLLPPPESLEQKLHALRRRHMKRAESGKGWSGWTPALQSIPEEN